MRQTELMRDKLLSMREEGHRFLTLSGKKPMTPSWQNNPVPDKQTLEAWLDQGYGIGWIQDRTAALDFDDLTDARRFWQKEGPFRCAIQRSPRGVHLIFKTVEGVRNAVNVRGLYDIRAGGNGYLKYYGFVEGYDTTDPEKLDTFRREWLPNKKVITLTNEINNVRAYINKIQSVQGQNGSASLIRAISKCREAGLTQSEATVEILDWNKTSALPPWSLPELTRAITRVYEVYK